MRLRIFNNSSLAFVRRAGLFGAACAGALLLAGNPSYAQLVTGPGIGGPGAGPGIGSGAAPVVGPAIINAPPMQTQPVRPGRLPQRSNVDQTIRGVRAPDAKNNTVVAPNGELSGTFVADVSSHLQTDFSNLTTDLRSAIESSQGNVREKLIAINDRVSAISSNLVDRAKETKEQARDRMGDVRNELNVIHNDLTALAANGTDDAQAKITAARDRVDTLRDHLQTATENRFRHALGHIQDAAQNLAGRLQQRAANVEQRAEQPANTTVARAEVLSAEVQTKAREDVGRVRDDLSNLLVGVNESVRGRLESVDERLTAIHNDLEAKTDETAEAARARAAKVRQELQEVQTDLTNIAQNAGDEAKDRIHELRDRVATVRARLDVANIAGVVREQVGAVREQVNSITGGVLSSGQPGIEINSQQQGKLGVTVRQGATALTITSVFEGSVAAQAGLRPGDQILAVNRRRIITHGQLVSELEAAAHGDGNPLLMIRRDGRTQEVRANLTGTARDAQPANGVR